MDEDQENLLSETNNNETATPGPMDPDRYPLIAREMARAQQRRSASEAVEEKKQQAKEKVADMVKKRTMQAAMQAARAAAVAAWSALSAAVGPYVAIALVCLLLILITAVPAFAIWSKARGGTYGNKPPQYVQAYDASTSQDFLELLGKNPGGLNLPYDTNKYGKTISSTFGGENPGRRNHRGIDIPLPIGVRYYSIADGEVIYLHDSEKDGDEDEDLWHNGVGKTQNHGFGNAIAVRISSGKWAGYVFEIHHLKQGSATGLGLQKGSTIKAGQPIGMSGHNGQSTGPHLHFSIAIPEPHGHCESYIGSVGQPCTAPSGKLTTYFVNPKIPLGWAK